MQIREQGTVAPSASGGGGDITPEMRSLFEMHAGICQALANPHRLAIIHLLQYGERSVTELAEEIGISVHNASQHLRVLRQRLLVRPRKEGQTVYYSITNPKLLQACALICEALIEEHEAEGQFLQAAGFVDAMGVGSVDPAQEQPQYDNAITAINNAVDKAGTGLQEISKESKEKKFMNTADDSESVDLSSLRGQKVVDARGTSCPGPVLAAKKGMAEVKVGEIMEVLATDSGTQRDLPAWAKKMGHEYLGCVEDAGYMKLFVKKMK